MDDGCVNPRFRCCQSSRSFWRVGFCSSASCRTVLTWVDAHRSHFGWLRLELDLPQRVGQRDDVMRAVVQRVSQASVSVDGELCGAIQKGLLVYLGVADTDGPSDVTYLSEKLIGLRVFPDADGHMNLDVRQAGGSLLVISNFTLLGDAQKGRRPSFVGAAAPEDANELYEGVVASLRAQGVEVATGRFRTMMDVHSVNDGPVTILVDSQRVF